MKMATYKDLQVAIKVEAAGIEPASRGISMPASTCVADYLCLARQPPIDRVLDEPAGNRF